MKETDQITDGENPCMKAQGSPHLCMGHVYATRCGLHNVGGGGGRCGEHFAIEEERVEMQHQGGIGLQPRESVLRG